MATENEYQEEREDEIKETWTQKWINWTNVPYYVLYTCALLLIFINDFNIVFTGLIFFATVYLMKPEVKVVKRQYFEPKLQVDYIAQRMATGGQLNIPAFSDVPFVDVEGRPNSSLIHIDSNHFAWVFLDQLGIPQLLVSRTFRDAEGPFKEPLVAIQSCATQYLEPQYLMKLAQDIIKGFEGTRKISEMMQKYGVSEGVVEQLIIRWAQKSRIRRRPISSVVSSVDKVNE